MLYDNFKAQVLSQFKDDEKRAFKKSLIAMPPYSASRLIRWMVDEGWLEKSGRTRDARYRLTESMTLLFWVCWSRADLPPQKIAANSPTHLEQRGFCISRARSSTKHLSTKRRNDND